MGQFGPSGSRIKFIFWIHWHTDGPNSMWSFLPSPHVLRYFWNTFGFSVGGRSAGCFSAPTAQSGTWQGQKWKNGWKSFFWGLSLKSFPVLGKAIFRVKMSHFVWFFMHFDKLIRRPLGPLCPLPGRGGGGDDIWWWCRWWHLQNTNTSKLNVSPFKQKIEKKL